MSSQMFHCRDRPRYDHLRHGGGNQGGEAKNLREPYQQALTTTDLGLAFDGSIIE
jgi:hypothetical protein